MPTDTFFRLPKEKQKIILKSAMEEFSKIPYIDVSINRVIQNAKISRGSFYMYFKDKEDLYCYLTRMHQKKMYEMFQLALKKRKRDLIETYLELFQMTLTYIETAQEKKFFQNMILNMDFKNDLIAHKQNHRKELIDFAINEIDLSKLSIQKKEVLIDVMELIQMSFMHGLVKIFAFDCEPKVAYQTFYRQLMILKEGLYQEGGENYD